MTSPINALDPKVMLATSVHAQPGVYALLLGSGVSTGAGIPTGWGVVTELIRRAATAQAPTDESAGERAAADPEAWWAEYGDGHPLGYSNLLASLGTTPGARQAVLRSFFEPSDDDLEQGLKTPSSAHRAIAAMVKRGAIKVILTTNFDRLMERALADVGVSAQVIAAPEQVAGMTPLAHASATVVKLHGDYVDLQIRNTVDELASYPEAWDALLDRILNEYGLVISGWSADWDKALVGAMRRTPHRRYPLFWDARSGKGEIAAAIIAQHRAVVVSASSADALFQGLDERLIALDRLSEPPVTTAIATQRLKRYLPDPTRRIDLHDLVMSQLEPAIASIAAQSVQPTSDMAAVAALVESHISATTPMVKLLSTAVQHDRNQETVPLLVEVLQRLITARGRIEGAYNSSLDRLRHLPALLVMRGLGITALKYDRDDILIALMQQPRWRTQYGAQTYETAAAVLDEYDVLGDLAGDLPRWNGTKWRYPASHLLIEVLRDPLAEHFPDVDDYRTASYLFEFSRNLLVQVTGSGRITPGEFVGDTGWDHGLGEPTMAGVFRERASQANADWPWWDLTSDKESLEQVLKDLSANVNSLRRW